MVDDYPGVISRRKYENKMKPKKIMRAKPFTLVIVCIESHFLEIMSIITRKNRTRSDLSLTDYIGHMRKEYPSTNQMYSNQ